MSSLRVVAALLAAFPVIFVSTFALARPIVVNGSTTVDALLMTPYKAQIEREGNVALNITPSNSGRGLSELSMGVADIAMISAPFADVLTRVNQTTNRTLDPSEYVTHEIGHATILFIANLPTPVGPLSARQLADILTGRIDRWSKVGGPNTPVSVVTEQATGAMRTEIVAKLLGGTDITPLAATVPHAVDAVEMVAAIPGSIGFVSSVIRDHLDRVTVLKTDTNLTQTLILVTKKAPPDDVTAAVGAIEKVAAGVLQR